MERFRNLRKYPQRGSVSENDNQVRENSDSHGSDNRHHSGTAGIPGIIDSKRTDIDDFFIHDSRLDHLDHSTLGQRLWLPQRPRR
jgi:hypothetical protein